MLSPLLFSYQRPTEVTVRYQDLGGSRHQLRLRGFQARVFQHEYDHLDGVLFHDRMKKKERDTIKDQLIELETQYCGHNGISESDSGISTGQNGKAILPESILRSVEKS